MASQDTILQIDHLTFSYAGQSHPTLQEITIQIPKGSFFLLCGTSGGGKSTLLRCLHPSLQPNGNLQGSILWNSRPMQTLSFREQATCIGFVQQNPDTQIVTDKVWHELAFGMESLGYETAVIRRRVAEIANFFGIQHWFHKSVQELSGGQKQILNLASCMVLSPELLILDEPSSQLDPIASRTFFELLVQINRELGTTILLAEHRLEEVMPLADTMAVLEAGEVLYCGKPAYAGRVLAAQKAAMYQAMPCAVKVWSALQQETLDTMASPVTVQEGHNWLLQYVTTHPISTVPPCASIMPQTEVVLSAEEVWFRYEKDTNDIVKSLTLQIRKGEWVAILGGNGTGKTTALKLLAGLYKPYRGAVRVEAKQKIALLAQNPQTLFVRSTVRADLMAVCHGTETDLVAKVEAIAAQCQISHVLDQHPYDLSGGEQQRAALAKLLLCEPKILLLDEPTKGCDVALQHGLADILQTLQQTGVTIVMVSHDIEFCAQYAQRCMLFFDGAVIAEDATRAFFAGNQFYTTAAHRMAQQILPDAVLAEDIIQAFCTEQAKTNKDITAYIETKDNTVVETETKRVENKNGTTKDSEIECTKTEYTKTEYTKVNEQPSIKEIEKSTKSNSALHTIVVLLTLLLIAGTLCLGIQLQGTRHYYVMALLILVECMLPAMILFEGRKPLAREIVIIAVLCAIAIVGRAAFFMLPQVKPVMAVVILSGAALGSEVGMLVGAITMLVSNLLFAQGPWTPWQMFAMGLVGALAGVVFRNAYTRTRLTLSIFGLYSAIFLYGVIMNFSSALLYQAEWNTKILLAYLISGFPMDCVHGFATVLFLWIAANPVLEKLERLKMKYGCFSK